MRCSNIKPNKNIKCCQMMHEYKYTISDNYLYRDGAIFGEIIESKKELNSSDIFLKVRRESDNRYLNGKIQTIFITHDIQDN